MKIGLIIPCTSKQRNWDNIKESYIYKYTMKTFIHTCNREHDYIIYVGYDKDDRIFSKEN